jgi:hypothetical protein
MYPSSSMTSNGQRSRRRFGAPDRGGDRAGGAGADHPVMASLAGKRTTSAVPTTATAHPVFRLSWSFGEPGGLQVQVALQALAGGGADGAGVVEPGQLGAFGGDEVAAQFSQASTGIKTAPWARATLSPQRSACRLPGEPLVPTITRPTPGTILPMFLPGVGDGSHGQLRGQEMRPWLRPGPPRVNRRPVRC